MPYDPRDRAVRDEQLPTVRPWVMETWPARMASDAITKARELGEIGTTSGAFLPSDQPELTDEIVARTTGSTGPLFGGGLARAALAAPSRDVELGIFAGPRSKTANIDALHEAFRMKGAPKEDIWQRTGWAELPDKNWMYEISDDLYQLHPNPENANKFVGPHHNEKFGWDIGGATSHGPLFEAYPDVAKVFLKRDAPPRSGYSQAPYTDLGRRSEGTIGIAPEVAEAPPSWTSVGIGTDMNSPESVLLHELQHQVQAREGWVGGSSPSIVQDQMSDLINAGEVSPEIMAGMSNVSDPELRRLVHNLYERDLGEMMARATQYRQDLSPLERRNRHPFLDFDRGIENAIVPR